MVKLFDHFSKQYFVKVALYFTLSFGLRGCSAVAFKPADIVGRQLQLGKRHCQVLGDHLSWLLGILQCIFEVRVIL